MIQSASQDPTAVRTAPITDSGMDEVFVNIFDFYGSLDTEGRILSLQGRIFEKINTDHSLLIGQRFAETVFWQSSENTPKQLERAIESAVGGKVSELLLDFRISAEEKIPMELHLQLIESHGTIKRIFFCAKAVQLHERVDGDKDESKQLLFAAENAEIGLWFWDFTENRIYSTPSCNELLGLPAYQEITPESFLEVIHPEDRSYAEEFLRNARSEGTRYQEEFRVVYPDEMMEWISAEGRSFLNENGSPQKMTGVLRKVTEEKLAAEELERVYEREKRARDEAVEANRAKDFFLAFVSHELRSPLNAILGWAKILLTKQVDDETRLNALETIERSARFQTKLINDLVDSARVASGKLRLEYHPTDLSEVVRVSFEAQKPAAQAQHLEFSYHNDAGQLMVFGDAGRLQQVFTNLISNAIKFTPEGGQVTVTVEANSAAATVRIRDTGLGIPEDALPHIFRQFSQGDVTRARNNAGLGLGLSIVKILVAKHRGTVEARSEGAGKGSEFVVTLPLYSAGVSETQTQESSAAPHRPPLRGITVLVVEDDFDSREVLQLFLEQSGADVLPADSAKAALSLAQRSDKRPSVIVSDLAMPDEDGYSLLTKVRNLPDNEGGNVPAIALSAFATAESKRRALEVGFQKYASKPFDPDQLVRDILELVPTRETS